VNPQYKLAAPAKGLPVNCLGKGPEAEGGFRFTGYKGRPTAAQDFAGAAGMYCRIVHGH